MNAEMDLTVLRPDQREFFDENGYLVVPDVLSPEEVARLTAVCDPMVDEWRKDDACYVQRRPGIVEEKTFHPLLAHSDTVPLVVQLLSPNIHLHTAAIIYKFPEPNSESASRGWHRDIGMTEDLGHNRVFRAGVKVDYCLTDFPEPQCGFTMFAPGSHLMSTPLPIPRDTIDPERTVDLCLNAGDVFLFENRIFHTAAPNLSKRTSKVLIFGYSYRWMGGRGDLMALVQPGDDPARSTISGSSCSVAPATLWSSGPAKTGSILILSNGPCRCKTIPDFPPCSPN